MLLYNCRLIESAHTGIIRITCLYCTYNKGLYGCFDRDSSAALYRNVAIDDHRAVINLFACTGLAQNWPFGHRTTGMYKWRRTSVISCV